MKKKKANVIVAMSGGVDSSVAAALLKKRGFDVSGMFIKCWDAEDPFGEHCSASDDERMGRLAAAKIGIPFYSINLVQEYRKKVVEYLINGYKKGITPNPDAMCNKEIKFGLFFDKAMELGAEYMATGHYARLRREARSTKSEIREKNENVRILRAKDKNKDQSYFLAFVKREVLRRILFPIGEYTKPEVRELARGFGLPNAERKDSQGICFVGKVDFVDFLKRYIQPKPGDVVDTRGNVLGKHEGAFYYTIGQRKGLGLAGGPYFVVGKDVKKNILVVSGDEGDLAQKEVKAQNMNWFVQPSGCRQGAAAIRYRQKPAAGVLHIGAGGASATFTFNEVQRAITPGQSAVFYSGDHMLAGGVIVG